MRKDILLVGVVAGLALVFNTDFRMDFAIILEYLKVILSAPVMTSMTVLTFLFMFRLDVKELMARIAKIKFPGGEFEASQLDKQHGSISEKGAVPIVKDGSSDVVLLPPTKTGDSSQEVIDALRSEAALWEYRYLNFFFVRNTQAILDWFAVCSTSVTISLFNATWLTFITNPNERNAILDALRTHHLISIENDLVQVTPKGREYLQWRGPLPITSIAT